MKKSLVVGGGCFWCVEAVYEMLIGVESVVSGYANGETENPDYRGVCSGKTGYAEVVRIEYESDTVSTQELLDIFFEIHDPTTLNYQEADRGTQYRSTILYESDEDKILAIEARDAAQKNFVHPIVTIIEPLVRFYEAEGYHQDYYRLNPTQGYCMAVIAPKVLKARMRYTIQS